MHNFDTNGSAKGFKLECNVFESNTRVPKFAELPKVGIILFPELKSVSKNSESSTEGLSLLTLVGCSIRYALDCDIILSGIDGEHDGSHKES